MGSQHVCMCVDGWEAEAHESVDVKVRVNVPNTHWVYRVSWL